MGIIAGLLGCLFGVLGILTFGVVFVPLAALCSAVGLLRGMAGMSLSGIAVSLIGGVLTIVGFVASPSLWLLAGSLFVASQINSEPPAPAPSAPITANAPAISPAQSNDASQGAAAAAQDDLQASASKLGIPTTGVLSAPVPPVASSAPSDETPPAPPKVAPVAQGNLQEPEAAPVAPASSASEPVSPLASSGPSDNATAAQPSFDCVKAATAIERTICSDPELARSDGLMGQAFKRSYAQTNGGQRRALLAAQRRWIATRKRQCDVPDPRQCILHLTETRVATLVGFASVASPTTASEPAAAQDFRPEAQSSSAQPVPKFVQFPSPVYRGPVGRLDLSSPNAYEYRTRLRNGARQPVNFAGHYQLVQWGCGTDCGAGAIIDVFTGHATFLPEVTTQGMEAVEDESFNSVEFRADSRLIVFSGQLDETGVTGTHFELWNGSGFQELLSVPFVPPSTTEQAPPQSASPLAPVAVTRSGSPEDRGRAIESVSNSPTAQPIPATRGSSSLAQNTNANRSPSASAQIPAVDPTAFIAGDLMSEFKDKYHRGADVALEVLHQAQGQPHEELNRKAQILGKVYVRLNDDPTKLSFEELNRARANFLAEVMKIRNVCNSAPINPDDEVGRLAIEIRNIIESVDEGRVGRGMYPLPRTTFTGCGPDYKPVQIKAPPTPDSLPEKYESESENAGPIPPDAYSARLVPIEENANIYNGYGTAGAEIDAAVETVRSAGYRCESVSAIHPIISGPPGFPPGTALVCDHFRYGYDIRYINGRWNVFVLSE